MENTTYITYGIEKINPEYFTAPYLWSWRGRGDKPCGGLWASPVEHEHSWYEECHKLSEAGREDMYPEGFDEAFSKFVKFRLKKESKVLKIDSPKDYMEALVKYATYLGYEYHMEKSGPGDFDIDFKKDYEVFGIDWEKVAKDNDAVIVSWKAIQEVDELIKEMKDYGIWKEKRFLGLGTWAVETLMLCNLECIEY